MRALRIIDGEVRVAQLLGARGRSVPLLTLLDTFLPPAAKPDDASRSMGPADVLVPRRKLRTTRLRVLGAGVLRYDPAVHQEVFHQQGARVAQFHRLALGAAPALATHWTRSPTTWRGGRPH